MMPSRQERLEALFDEALALSSEEERTRFVKERCPDDPSLSEEVLGMLNAHHQAEGFLKTAADSGDAPTLMPTEPSEGPGSVLGRYKLLQKIGEGGFGVVYMAEQEEPVRRRVALKIIKLGMDTRQVIARFEAERQALAMMDHPNIAKVLDAGCTETGRPYFVMELVRGVALTTYCDQENLPTRERLLLFIDICQAIQHAHLKGIIHRDVKPSNVMITMHDGKPVPKVIDFGIAKATQQRLTEKTLFTQYQQFIGTPAYMSPEQAEMSGLDVDTRTDVYALGVMLYELLIGRTPFDAAELIRAGYDEIRRRIREDEPSKPSTRLATLADNDATDIARHRRCEPQTLAKSLRGDLDWIVMTAMEKDRQRRYESPSLLAKDVARYLENEAVEARPPSIIYRLRKFVSRYRLACTAGAITAASMIAGLFFSIYGLTEARKSLALAQANEKTAQTERARADREAAALQRRLYPASLAAAEQAIRAGKRQRAEEHLAVCAEEERGWEWHHIAQHLTKPQRTFVGHDTSQCVYDVSYHASGSRLTSAGEDGTVRIWNTNSSLPLTTFTGHEGPVLRSTFLKQDDRLVSIGSDQTLRILDARNGEELSQATSQGNSRKVGLSPNGLFIVTADSQGTIRLWSRNLDKELAIIPSQAPDISALAVHAEAQRIAAVTDNNRIFLWDFEGVTVSEQIEDGLGFGTVQFSPSGKVFATGHEEGRVTLRDSRDGHSLKSWKAHNRSVGALAFSPDESLIATTGWEGGLSIRDIASGEELGFLLTKETHIHAVSFSPDGRRVATAGQRGSLAEWSLDQLMPPTVYLGHENLVFEAMPTPNGDHIASVGRDGTARLWEKSSGLETSRLRAHDGSIFSLDINADGSRLATRGSDGQWRLWELPSGRLLRTHPIDPRVRNLRFSPDGKLIATGAKREGSEPGTTGPAIGIWDVARGEELTRLEGHRGPIMRMDFHPDGTHLVSTSQHDDKAQDGRALVWELETGKQVLTLLPEGDAVSNSALWSHDGARIYTGHSDGRVCFWNASTGQLEETLFAHGEMVGALELSQDGKRLLTSAWYSAEAKLWHPVSGEFQFALDTGIPGISDVGFDSDDQAILAAGMDGGLKRFKVSKITD